MSFSNMLEILQEKNKDRIVLIRLGTFYIATGRDALLLHTMSKIYEIGNIIGGLIKYYAKDNKK